MIKIIITLSILMKKNVIDSICIPLQKKKNFIKNIFTYISRFETSGNFAIPIDATCVDVCKKSL